MPDSRRLVAVVLGLVCAAWATVASGQNSTVKDCFHEDQAIQFGPEGLIVSHENDYGDTAQREGWFWVGEWIRRDVLKLPPTSRKLSFDQVLALLEPARDGVFVRAPMFDAFGRDGKDQGFSRDQMVPLVAAMGLWGRKDELQRLWNAMPEDLLGKHAFNGEWRTLLNQPAPDCSAERKRDCSPQGDCSLKEDKTECSVGALRAEGKCPPERPCPSDSCATNQCHTECPCGTCSDFNCRVEVCLFGNCHTECPCGGCGDRNCRVQVCVPGVDLECQGRKTACEAQKLAENGVCEGVRQACEAQKLSKNLGYKGEHDACEAKKTADKDICEADKGAKIALCELKKQKFTGDLLGPMGVNLFVRGGVLPISLNPATLAMLGNFELGEAQLLLEIQNRIICSDRKTAGITCPKNDKGELPEPRANVGDDLDDIIMLLMARLRVNTPSSALAIETYRGRPHSYGSYFESVVQHHGCPSNDAELTSWIESEISSGVSPSVSGPYGAVRWYHRFFFTGANPALATMYRPIIDFLLK